MRGCCRCERENPISYSVLVVSLSHCVVKQACLIFANALIEMHGIVSKNSFTIKYFSNQKQHMALIPYVPDKCYKITFCYSYTCPFLQNSLICLLYHMQYVCYACLFLLLKIVFFSAIYSDYCFSSIYSFQFLTTPSHLDPSLLNKQTGIKCRNRIE